MERLKGSKVLVTGGAGFIGSYVVKELLHKGCRVSVIDITTHRASVFVLDHLQNSVDYIHLDIRNKRNTIRYIKDKDFNWIFHLAAEPIVEKSYKNPMKTLETNIMGTVHVLEAARAIKNLRGVIVASSDKAYGKSNSNSYTEETALRGDHPYDVSKSCEDLIAQAYIKTYNLPIVITRFGNVYGGGDVHTDRIIPDICLAYIQNKNLEIRSDGTYVRDYIYVEDVANAYMFLLENMTKAVGQAFNISSEDNFSVVDLVRHAVEILEKKIDYKILNNVKNEIPYQHLDCTKILKMGWKPRHSFKTSLKNTLSWYQVNWMHL